MTTAGSKFCTAAFVRTSILTSGATPALTTFLQQPAAKTATALQLATCIPNTHHTHMSKTVRHSSQPRCCIDSAAAAAQLTFLSRTATPPIQDPVCSIGGRGMDQSRHILHPTRTGSSTVVTLHTLVQWQCTAESIQEWILCPVQIAVAQRCPQQLGGAYGLVAMVTRKGG